MNKFSIEKLQKEIEKESLTSSYNTIAREANVPASTVWRIAQRRNTDINLSTANKIANAIFVLQKKRKKQKNI